MTIALKKLALLTPLAALLGAGCLDQPFATNVDLPLQVIAVQPSDGAEGVARDATLRVLFNLEVVEASATADGNVLVEDMSDPDEPKSIATERRYVAGDGDAAPALVLEPVALLPYSTPVRVTVTTNVQRAASEGIPEGALLKPVVATFQTDDPPALRVVSISPSGGATDVARDANIAITFSEPVRCSTVEAGLLVTETLDPDMGGGSNEVAGTLACDEPASLEDISCDGGACVVTFTPAELFSLSSTVQVSLAGGAHPDAVESYRATPAGGQLPDDVTVSFLIEDPDALLLVGSTPGNGATGVATDTGLDLSFSEAVACDSVQAAIDADELFVVETLHDGNAGAAQGVTLASCTGSEVSLAFSPGFSLSSIIDVTLPDTIRSERATTRGGTLVGGALITFSTLHPPPLRVVSTTPGNGAAAIATTTNLFVQFSEAIDCGSVVLDDVIVRESLDSETAASLGVATLEHGVALVSCGGSALELDPDADLQLSSNVEVVLPGSIASAQATLQGGLLEDGAGYGWSFSTRDPPDLLVVFTSPGDGNTLVPVDQPLHARFSEALDLASVSDVTFVVERLDGAGTVVDEISAGCGTAADGQALGVACSYAPSQADTAVTFTPPAELEYDTRYRFTLTTGIKSSLATGEGGSLGVTLVYDFKTIVSPPIEVVSLLPDIDVIDLRPTFTVALNQEIFAPTIDISQPADLDIFLAPVAAPGDLPDPNDAVALDCPACNSAGETFELTPTADLVDGTTYVLLIRGDLGGVRGTSGGAIMLADYSRAYIVGEGAVLLYTDPADGDTDVSVAARVCVIFTEDIEPGSVDETTFPVQAESDLGVNVPVLGQYVFDGVDPLSGEPSGAFSSNRVCLQPDPQVYPCREIEELLPADTTVYAALTTGVETAAGEPLPASASWSFGTGGLPSLLAMGYESLPVIGLAGELSDEVPVTASIVFDFSQAVDPAALDGVILARLDTGDPVPVDAFVEEGGTRVRLVPQQNLDFAEDLPEGYGVAVLGGALGLLFDDGRYLGADAEAMFVTSEKTLVAISPPQDDPGFEAMIAPVTFSRPMYLPSINTATLVGLNDTTGASMSSVVGTDVEDDDSATYLPIPTWPEGDRVIVTATTGIMDALGNPLAEDVSVTYASIQAAPALAARTPTAIAAANLDAADNALVQGDRRITLTFAAPGAQLENRMLPPTFNAATLKVTDVDSCSGGGELPVENDFLVGASGAADKVVFWSTALLRSGCDYEVRLVQKDFANIYTASPKGLVGGDPDDVVITVTGEQTAPTLDGASPADADVDVLASAVLSWDFSEEMDPASIDAASVRVNDGTDDIPGLIEVLGDMVTFTPEAPLTGGLTYTATVEDTVTDLAGNAFAGDVRSFTVESTPPEVTDVAVDGDGNILITFSEPMAEGSITPETLAAAGSVRVEDISGVEAVMTFGCVKLQAGGTVAVFMPIEPLQAGTDYRVTVTVEATDLGGTPLAAQHEETITP